MTTLTNTLTGLRIQIRVIGSLILRELQSRFGRDDIGFLWFIGEPMMLAVVITLLHVSQTSTHYSTDMGPAPFAIIGYTIFIIFRGVFNKSEGAVENNQQVLYHRMISILDVLLSKAVIEVLGCFITMVILLSLAVLFDYASSPARPLHLLAAVGLMAWWSFALAMIAASATYGSETLGRQTHVISYFSIPISGAFWQMAWLPPSFREPLQWFPMPLIFEQARYGMFRAASDEYVDPAYVSAWCAILTYIGLLMLRRLRRRIHV